MTDDADRASDYEERMREAAIRKRKPEPKPCGFCLNCGEPCRENWCDKDCLSDYELRTRHEFRDR